MENPHPVLEVFSHLTLTHLGDVQETAHEFVAWEQAPASAMLPWIPEQRTNSNDMGFCLDRSPNCLSLSSISAHPQGSEVPPALLPFSNHLNFKKF